MNLQFIKYFVVLSETGNFTHAAEKVHVVQSSFSTGIKKLEEQLNCKLFYRDNRKVLLTEAGKELLPRAKKLLSIWNEMESFYVEEQQTVLKLGIVNEIDFNAIVPTIKSFHEAYPYYQIQVIEENNLTKLKEKLKQRELDAFFLKYDVDAEELDRRLMRKDPLALAVPNTHPFAKFDKIDLKLIDGQDFIERTNCSLYEEVHSYLQKEKITPKIVFRARGDDMARALVSAAVGISLIPVIEVEHSKYKLVNLSGQQFHRKIYLNWDKSHLPRVLKRFLEF